jgi:hypothetical protein
MKPERISNGTFVHANNSTGNYVKFNATAFTVTTPGTATDSVQRAPLNAIQIIPKCN